MPLEDNELMRRVAEQNDTYAFEELVLRYRASAVAFAVRYTQDHYLAEDLAQEAFARLYLKRYQFHTDGSFRAYFYRILRNVCIDHYRQHSRTTEVELHTSQIVQHNTPETIAISQEKSGLVRRLLASLDERYRTAIYLQQFEGMSYQEIAAAMNISTGQVRMLLYRGRKKLKKLIERELK